MLPEGAFFLMDLDMDVGRWASGLVSALLSGNPFL